MSTPVPSGLPPHILSQLRDLEEELAEGDITQKGFEKKRKKLLDPFRDRPNVEEPSPIESDSPYSTDGDDGKLPEAVTEGVAGLYMGEQSEGEQSTMGRPDFNAEPSVNATDDQASAESISDMAHDKIETAGLHNKRGSVAPPAIIIPSERHSQQNSSSSIPSSTPKVSDARRGSAPPILADGTIYDSARESAHVAEASACYNPYPVYTGQPQRQPSPQGPGSSGRFYYPPPPAFPPPFESYQQHPDYRLPAQHIRRMSPPNAHHTHGAIPYGFVPQFPPPHPGHHYAPPPPYAYMPGYHLHAPQQPVHQRSRSAGNSPILPPEHASASHSRQSSTSDISSQMDHSAANSAANSAPHTPTHISREGSVGDYRADEYYIAEPDWAHPESRLAYARHYEHPHLAPYAASPYAPIPGSLISPSRSPTRISTMMSQRGWKGTVRIPQQFHSPLHSPRLKAINEDFTHVASLLGRQALPTRRREIQTNVTDEGTRTSLSSFPTIAAVLRFRAQNTPKDIAYTVLDYKGRDSASITYEKLNARAERVAQTIKEKSSLKRGDNVALLYRRTEVLEFLVAFYGCLYAGMVAVPIVTSSTHVDDELTEVVFILDNCKIQLALTTDLQIKTLTREFHVTRNTALPRIDWVKTNDLGSSIKKKRADQAVQVNSAEVAYIEYTKNAVGELKGIMVDHKAIMSQCAQLKAANGFGSKDIVLTSLEPRQQAGLIIAAFLGISLGSMVVLMSETGMGVSGAWVMAVTRHKVTIAFADNPSMMDVLHSFPFTPQKKNPPDLSSLHTLFLNSTLPHAPFIDDVARVLSEYRMKSDVISPLLSLDEFGGMALGMRERHVDEGERREKLDIWVDAKALREDRVDIVGYSGDGKTDVVREIKGALRLTEIGFIAPDVSIAIVDPDTKALQTPNILGEIWVTAPDCFPQSFWALPKLSEQILHAHPLIYIRDNPHTHHRTPSVTSISRDNIPPFRVEAIENQNFAQTGLLGFIIDGNTVPGVKMPRLFVAGVKKDRILQRKIKDGQGMDMIQDQRANIVSQRTAEFDAHFGSDLVETIMKNVSGIDCCAAFTVFIHNEHLPIVVFETSRPAKIHMATAEEIAAILKAEHGLRVYCISVCATNSLPRSNPDTSIGTQMQTTFHGYTSGVVSIPPMNDAEIASLSRSHKGALPPAVNKKKFVPLDVEMCKSAFLAGELHFIQLYMDVEKDVISTIASYDPSNDPDTDLMARIRLQQKVGQVVGGMVEVPLNDDKTNQNLAEFATLSHLLAWRAESFPNETAFAVLDHRGKESKGPTFQKFAAKVQALAAWLVGKKGVKPLQHVILMYTHGQDYMIAFHACLYAGIIPIPLAPLDGTRIKEDVPVLIELIDEFDIKNILVNGPVEETLRGKHALAMIRAVRQSQSGVVKEKVVSFPTLVNTVKVPKSGKSMSLEDPIFYYADPSAVPEKARSVDGLPAVVLTHFTADMRPTCVRLSHTTLMQQSRVLAIHGHLMWSTLPAGTTGAKPPSYVPLLSCVRSYSGLGFLYSMMLGVYVGAPTLILPPFDYFMNPHVWFESLYKYRVKDAFATYPMLEHAMGSMKNAEYRSFSLHNVRNLMITTEGRTRPDVYTAIHQNFLANRLEDQSVATVYSPVVNPMVSTRGYMQTEITTLWLDMKTLKKGRVNVLKETRGESGKTKELLKDSEGKEVDALILQDSGKIPNNTIVAIVDPSTNRLCPPDEYGEIWVCSPGNVAGYCGRTTAHGKPVSDQFNRETFANRIEGLDPSLLFARTGDRGFLWPVPADGAESNVLGGSLHSDPDAGVINGWDGLVFAGLPYEMVLFVVGAMHEELSVNGFRYFQQDVEKTVEACHRSIPNGGCVMFQPSSNQVVCVTEIIHEGDILNAVPRIIHAVLDQHGFLIDAVAFLAAGALARSRLGEKQRWRVAKAYRSGKLPTLRIFQVRPQKDGEADTGSGTGTMSIGIHDVSLSLEVLSGTTEAAV